MKRSVASLTALLLAATLFAGPASAAGAETETQPLHATECQESAGLETCLRVRGVLHSTERSDGSVHQTFNYSLCITNKVDRKVVSTYCEQRHDTYLLKGDEPQVDRLSSTEDVRSLGETCRIRTVYHFVNGELRIERRELLGNCRLPD